MADLTIGQKVLDEVGERFFPAPCPRLEGFLTIPGLLYNDDACMWMALSRFAGLGIVIFAGLIKIPQIMSIASNKSAAGISKPAYMLETFGYVYNLAFAVMMKFPITAYGEFVLILFQNLIVLFLIFKYEKKPATGLAIVGGYVLATMFGVLGFVPVDYLRKLTAMNFMTALGARVPQIWKNYKSGSVGSLSPFTCAGLCIGSLTRILTTLKEVNEPTILLGFGVAFLLNLTILIQVIDCKVRKPAGAMSSEPKIAESALQAKKAQ